MLVWRRLRGISTLTPQPSTSPTMPIQRAAALVRRLNIGFLFRPSDETPEDLAMRRILDSGLLNYGSRLFERLRYAVSSTYQISTVCLRFRRSAVFAIHGLSPRSSVLRVVEEVLTEYARLRAGDVPIRWFESTRDLVAFESQSCVDSAEGAAEYYATAECSEFGNGRSVVRAQNSMILSTSCGGTCEETLCFYAVTARRCFGAGS